MSWSWLVVVLLGSVALHAAWIHDTSNAITFAVGAAIYSVVISYGVRKARQ